MFGGTEKFFWRKIRLFDVIVVENFPFIQPVRQTEVLRDTYFKSTVKLRKCPCYRGVLIKPVEIERECKSFLFPGTK